MGGSHLPNITIPPPKGESSGGAQSRPDPRHQGALGLSSPQGEGAGVCPPHFSVPQDTHLHVQTCLNEHTSLWQLCDVTRAADGNVNWSSHFGSQ